MEGIFRALVLKYREQWRTLDTHFKTWEEGGRRALSVCIVSKLLLEPIGLVLFPELFSVLDQQLCAFLFHSTGLVA